MKIGVISDTHGIVPAWEQAMKLFEGADLILHAGDVLYHPPRLGCDREYDVPSLVKLMNESPIPIVIARGNCDSEVYEELLSMPVLAPYAFVEHNDLRIVIRHGHNLTPQSMQSLARKYRAHVFITGHTHIPVLEHVDGALHMNPGSPSHPRSQVEGVPTPTIGLITNGRAQILALETGKELLSMSLIHNR